MFNLKTQVSELSSTNNGLSKAQYDQHAPTRDVTGSNFPNGAIHIRFETAGNKWWVPSKSYIRMRCALTKADGTTALIKSDGVAPTMGLAGSLFQSMEFRIAGKTVSRLSDFVSQVDSLETRMNKSKAWMDSIGVTTNFWDDSYANRQSIVVADGKANGADDVITDRLQMGHHTDNEVGISATTGVLTFAGTTPPDARVFWNIGDIIEVDVSATDRRQYRVSAIPSALTLQLSGDLLVAVGSAVKPFRRIRPASRGVSNFEIIWQPPLSIFKVDHAMPAGKYELVLNPQTSSVYQKYAIETRIGFAEVTDFKFNVEDLYMYVHSVEGPRVDNMTYLLDLEQTRCQSDSIDNTSFGQKNFDVSPSTHALTVAFQDLRAGSNTQLLSSKFRSYDAKLHEGAGIVYTDGKSQELDLTRLFVNYGGQNYPSPDADPSFTDTEDYTTQRYVETQLETGAFHDTGGAETIEEWHSRGAYYHMRTPRDGSDRSTRVMVNSGLKTTTDVDNMRVLLFDHSKQVARVTVQDSRVIDVQLEDV